ncbi:endonuclease 8-like 1 [Haliotis rufescens]|uniref:endonuclease 8-like 1 n=1 Tax=Haliotis rufescens TaxID=6454 RepID=UPI00201F848B|nr:endonuclease 8-like 1 [Haliotis rufescens]
MPEGPELHLASRFVNFVCKGRVFAGEIMKSEVHKSKDVSWEHEGYTISASSRGKELKLTLTALDDSPSKDKKKPAISPRSVDIMFQFGMSGKFHFCGIDEMEKHSHLNFYTKEEEDSHRNVLSFVDQRRFGKWSEGADWGADRGPCVMFEYPAFRQRVLDNLHQAAFNKPICEVLLNQKYFNGIGNYLRAEILYRGGVRPFECARSVLEKLAPGQKEKKVVVKSESPDILQMCNLLPLEVIEIGATGYGLYGEKSFTEFTDWLQCYYNPTMKNMADHNKRTIWFTGDPGPMVPKEQKTKRVKKTSKIVKRKSEQMVEAGEELPEVLQSPTKKKKTDGRMTRKKLHDTVEKETKPKPKPKPKTAKTEKVKRSKSVENVRANNARTEKVAKSSTSQEKVAKSSRGKPGRSRKSSDVDEGVGDSLTSVGKGTEVKVKGGARRTTRTCSRESRTSSSSGDVNSSVKNLKSNRRGIRQSCKS